nr:type II inositol 34 bisphosphate 4 phosphatase [Hymenolepis microstoma]
MKFNGTDLGHISTHWGSTFEGILLLKQKSESFFKRSTFSEHWCRLKGNLLVIFRNEGACSKDLVGIVLLERCQAKTVVDTAVQNAFQIVFECGDPPMFFAARSAEEANMWCNHISKAGLSELSARRLQLREEIRNLTGKDPLDPLNPAFISRPACDPDEFNESGLEIQLSLLEENSSLFPDPDLGLQFMVYVKQPEIGDTWELIAETETKACLNFLKTVKLNAEKVSKSSLIMFSLLEFKDIHSSLSRVISSAEITAEALYNASTLNLHLHVDSETTSNSDYLLVVQVLNQRANGPDFDHLDPDSQQLRNVCETILTRNYVFPHTLGGNMRVVEFMGESRICFQFPIEYLKSLITQEHLLYDSLLRIGMSDPTLECLRRERLMGMKNTIELYELCLRSTVDHMGCFKDAVETTESGMRRLSSLCERNNLYASDPTLECLRRERLMGMKNTIELYELCLRSTVDHMGPSFKRSTERKCSELDFVPTNLHVNRIGLLDSENRLISSHDIISVGAFTSSSGKFKAKGLFQTIATVSNPDKASDNHNPHHSASLTEMLRNSPTARVLVSSALQYDKQSIGMAFRNLSTGGVVAVRLSGDLSELNTRLGPTGQAEILAQRLEKGMAALMGIFKSASIGDGFLEELQSNYEPLLKRIADLSALDSNQSDSVNETNRDVVLQEIASTSTRLQKVLFRTWEQVEESLWREVLSNLAAAASSCENSSAGMNLQAMSSIWDSIHYRHHTSLCQALTTTLTGLLIAVSHWSPAEWKQMVRCGVPLHFEGLLSCYGEEMCMLENWAWAIQSLEFCRIVIRPNDCVTPSVKNKNAKNGETDENERTGGGLTKPTAQILSHNEIMLTIPRTAWDRAPSEFLARGRIALSLHPFHFDVGINEQQTFAERLERVNLQSSINTNGLASMKNYFEKYTRKFGAPKKTPTQQDVCDVLRSLEYALKNGKSKPVEVLRLATEVSSSLNALRFTSCKSAKDRTAMSVTLEQVRWLKDVEGMHIDSFSPALKCLRSTGLRLSNVEKNPIGPLWAPTPCTSSLDLRSYCSCEI